MAKADGLEGQDSHLTHAQIWDDSSLVQSWNEAAEEYKKYHSIHARGEDMDDLLEKYENGILGDDLGLEAIDDVVSSGDQVIVNDQTVDMDIEPETDEANKEDEETSTNQDTKPTQQTKADLPDTTVNEPMASTLLTLPAGSNEDLKALMMSWYYAGYYTGLQEGKRQAQSGC
ncbi:hypothetical protein AAP_00434 [Ascosphaera apis ARSEF 7405]|uniref:Survival motor neuron Tudor domain-containing protein n=1 Tax=Ascosphaera apis ARSEF 7405 TaxID=392613 RepID=A0A168DW00_9EURO|nr:hypothetical protein AAP_00434 [Ascosphaera apis ARSEF 7405]